MSIKVHATKRYSCDRKQFSFETWEDELHITFDGAAESSEENDYDVSREIQVNVQEFHKRVQLIADMPTLEATLRIARDSWNTHSDASITIRDGDGDTINLEIDLDEYLFEKDELLAILDALI